jgi:phage gpG-like protein
VDVAAKVDASGATDELEALLKRVEQVDEFWRDLDDWWESRQSAWFSSGRIPLNDPATVRLKGSGQPLVDTGNLRDATMRNQPFSLGGSDATFGLRKGTPEYKLGILNLSGPRGAPKRNAVPRLTAAERREVLTMLRRYLTEVVQ